MRAGVELRSPSPKPTSLTTQPLYHHHHNPWLLFPTMMPQKNWIASRRSLSVSCDVIRFSVFKTFPGNGNDNESSKDGLEPLTSGFLRADSDRDGAREEKNGSCSDSISFLPVSNFALEDPELGARTGPLLHS